MTQTIYYSMQHLPEQERPRERFLRLGVDVLSTIELIAIVLGSGNKAKPVLQLAHDVVAHFGGLRELAEATVEELREIKGIGLAKAIQLKAALNLGCRISQQNPGPHYRITTPDQAYELIKDLLENATRELFVIILQNIKGYVICHEVISIGSLSEVIVHPREVFHPAIRHKAASLIVAHNHPSGDPTPSGADFDLTRVLIDTGFLLNIPVHDHLIIGHRRYFSLREEGFNFTSQDSHPPDNWDCV